MDSDESETVHLPDDELGALRGLLAAGAAARVAETLERWPTERIDALPEAGILLADALTLTGRVHDAIEVARRTRERCRAVPALQLEAVAALVLALVRRGDLDALAEAGAELSALPPRERAFDSSAARILHADGVLRLRTGDLDGARTPLLEALAAATAAGDGWRAAMIHDSLGILHTRLGDSFRAMTHLDSSLRAKERFGDKTGQAITHGNRGRLLLQEGWADQALEAYRANLALTRQTGDQLGEVAALDGCGGALLELRRLDEAESTLREALELALERDLERLAALCEKDLALVSERRGRTQEALARIDAAHARFTRLEILDGAGFCMTVRGRVLYRSDDVEGARRDLATAVRTLRETRRHDLLADALVRRAEASLDADPRGVQRWLRQAEELARRHLLRGVLAEVERIRALAVAPAPGHVVAARNTLGFGKTGREYLLMNEVASGGQGAAWRALEVQTGRLMLVKRVEMRVAAEQREVALRLLLREYEAAMRIDHPGVVRVHGFERSDLQFHIAMDLLPGQTLRSRLDAEPVPRQDAWAWIVDVGRATQALHDAGVVHRDLKPENVVFDAGQRPVLIDFGLALLDTAPGGAAAEAAGTYRYLAPEQLHGADISSRSDLFAIGVLATELLTGANFLSSSPELASFARYMSAMVNAEELEHAIARIAWPDDVSAHERASISALLAPRPADRPASVSAFLDAVGR